MQTPLVDDNTAWVLEEAIEVLAIIRNQCDPDRGIHPSDRLGLLTSLLQQAHQDLIPAIQDTLRRERPFSAPHQ